MRKTSNQVRIIGGRLRGRKLAFPDSPGLRPSPDRVRETLFNWLAPSLAGARCLDLFAGSGALGIEALSRGGRTLTMIDSQRDVCSQLESSIERLALTAVRVICADASSWLRHAPDLPFDVVFVDPPYQSNLLHPILTLLAQKLSHGVLIYWEHPAGQTLALPERLTIEKQKRAGAVVYYLGRIVTDSSARQTTNLMFDTRREIVDLPLGAETSPMTDSGESTVTESGGAPGTGSEEQQE